MIWVDWGWGEVEDGYSYTILNEQEEITPPLFSWKIWCDNPGRYQIVPGKFLWVVGHPASCSFKFGLFIVFAFTVLHRIILLSGGRKGRGKGGGGQQRLAGPVHVNVVYRFSTFSHLDCFHRGESTQIQ